MADLTHSSQENQFTGNPMAAIAAPKYAPALTILTEEDTLPFSKRLVVILPDADFDISSLPRRIWEMSAPDCRGVLLLIKPRKDDDAFFAQMNLTSLAAIVRDSRIAVQARLIEDQSLEQAVLQAALPDDLIVCFAEHQVGGWLKQRRLAEVLAEATRRPIYTLKGAVRENTVPTTARLANIFYLALCLLVLAAFFALEVWIDQNAAGTAQTVMMLLAVFVEVGILGVFATRGRSL